MVDTSSFLNCLDLIGAIPTFGFFNGLSDSRLHGTRAQHPTMASQITDGTPASLSLRGSGFRRFLANRFWVEMDAVIAQYSVCAEKVGVSHPQHDSACGYQNKTPKKPSSINSGSLALRGEGRGKPPVRHPHLIFLGGDGSPTDLAAPAMLSRGGRGGRGHDRLGRVRSTLHRSQGVVLCLIPAAKHR